MRSRGRMPSRCMPSPSTFLAALNSISRGNATANGWSCTRSSAMELPTWLASFSWKIWQKLLKIKKRKPNRYFFLEILRARFRDRRGFERKKCLGETREEKSKKIRKKCRPIFVWNVSNFLNTFWIHQLLLSFNIVEIWKSFETLLLNENDQF